MEGCCPLMVIPHPPWFTRFDAVGVGRLLQSGIEVEGLEIRLHLRTIYTVLRDR
jgi:hypothetical protein